MRCRTSDGENSIATAEKSLGAYHALLNAACEIAAGHQEKWGASGAPQGIAGQAIALSACLMALNDVDDALISNRVYQTSISYERGVAIIRESRGGQVDPDVCHTVLPIQDQLRWIACSIQ